MGIDPGISPHLKLLRIPEKQILRVKSQRLLEQVQINTSRSSKEDVNSVLIQRSDILLSLITFSPSLDRWEISLTFTPW